jgi:hypothetical protein
MTADKPGRASATRRFRRREALLKSKSIRAIPNRVYAAQFAFRNAERNNSVNASGFFVSNDGGVNWVKNSERTGARFGHSYHTAEYPIFGDGDSRYKFERRRL